MTSDTTPTTPAVTTLDPEDALQATRVVHQRADDAHEHLRVDAACAALCLATLLATQGRAQYRIQKTHVISPV